MDVDNLKHRWQSLCKSIKINNSESLFEDIINRYNEPHRHYHTLSHITACLGQLDSIRYHLESPMIVELALWFHDIIYNPKRTDNEKQSAVYAADKLSNSNLEVDKINRICRLIDITKHPSTPETIDEKYIVDIDLGILGAPTDVYLQYTPQIRKEYAHVPNFLYKLGRRKLLKQFLKTDTIYHTEHYRNKLETTARTNIQEEILHLKQPMLRNI